MHTEATKKNGGGKFFHKPIKRNIITIRGKKIYAN